MKKNSHIIKIFEEFQKIPIGQRIDNPKKLILLEVSIKNEHLRLLNSKTTNLFLTRKSLKHISEKNYPSEYFLNIICSIIEQPDTIHKSHSRRFIFSKFFHKNEKPYPHAIVLEVHNKNIIITTFATNQTYLRNFEILWRTETLSNGPSIST